MNNAGDDKRAERRQSLVAAAVTRGWHVVGFDESDRLVLHVGEDVVEARWDNLDRALDREEHPRLYKAWLDGLARRAEPLPPWENARRRVFFSAERPPTHHSDTLLLDISPALCGVVVHTDEDELHQRWVGDAQLRAWGIGEDELLHAAATNLAALLELTQVQVNTVHGSKTATLLTTSRFKSSMFMAPNLRQKVEPLLGWPVMAVAPERDFFLLFPESDKDLLPRLADLVVARHRDGAQPLTTEVLRCSDEGVEAVGMFSPGT